MSLTKSQIVILGLAFLIVLFFILIFAGVIPGLRQDTGSTVTLSVWGPFNDRDAIESIAADFRKVRPKTEVRYRQFNAETYEEDLLNALASSQAPDVIMFHNSWLPKHINKLAPANEKQFSFSSFKNLFPTVAQQDFAPDGIVYALPLFVDTLALFYNEDIFDNKGVVAPPKTWTELENLIPKLRELDKTGRIVKAAAAIGGSQDSIHNASDILNLIMLQSGAQMVDDRFTRATFDSSAGLEALGFYTQFGTKGNFVYTWDNVLGDSLTDFSDGNAAMIFDYSAQREILREKSPFLRFSVTLMPQPKDAKQNVNFANYWGAAVASKSLNPAIAWDFISYLAADSSAAFKYLQITKRPPALRSLINANLNNLDYGVFAQQALTARSWPQIDNNKIAELFSDMIKSSLDGLLLPNQALEEAENEVTALMQRRIR